MAAVSPTLKRTFGLLSRPVRIGIAAGLVITVLCAILCGIASSIAQPQLPLWYTLSQPSAVLTERIWILTLPGLCLLLELTTICLVMLLSELDQMILGLFTWTSVFAQGLLLFAAIRILYITA